MEPNVSIIVPVYNVEQFLERCVESILKQTMVSFELLLIDDGSSDRSGQLCDELSQKDNRIRVIHIPNGGVSNARNLGIKVSRGEWISFIDSDDFVTEDYLETLLKPVRKDETIGFSIGKLHHIQNGVVTPVPESSSNLHLWNTEQTLKELLTTQKTSFFPVAKLFRKSLIQDLTFNTKYHLAEDALFLTELLLHTKCQTVFIDKPIYFYDHREGSATTSVNQFVFDTILVYRKIIAMVSNVFPELELELQNRELWSYVTVYDKLIFANDTDYTREKNEIRDWIISHQKELLRDPYFTKFRKCAIFLLRFSPFLYKKIVSMKK